MTLFEQLIERVTVSYVEDFYALCSTLETFIDIDECFNLDFIGFTYENIEKELLFAAQERLERHYGLLEHLITEDDFEKFYEGNYCIDGMYLEYNKCNKAIVINVNSLMTYINESDLKDNWEECLDNYINEINNSTTLKLMKK